MAKAKNNKKRKLHTNHAESRKPARPVQRKDAKSSSKQQQQQSNKPVKVLQPTIPFLPAEDRILLIGEGDFSFAKSIVEEHGCCDVTATSYDSRDELFTKYNPQAEEHVKYLEEEGQHVLYSVDATKLDKNKPLVQAVADGGKFDVVMFNFPHVGGKSTDVNRQVRFNQELLVGFFKIVQELLAQNGTIVVTLFEGEPYTLWNIRDLGRHTGLEVARSFKFQAEAYPGYSHARTLGNIDGGGGWKGEDRDARSYVFQLKAGAHQNGGKEAPKTQAEMQKEMERQRRERLGAGDKRKRAKDDDSDSEDD